jgi:hypothetical protein
MTMISSPIATTKILAIGRVTAKGTPAARGPIMPLEIRATARLYLAGKIEQWYSLAAASGVMFILSMTDVNEAHALLEKLPLGEAGMMEFELIPLGALKPLALLLIELAPPSAKDVSV